MVIAISPNKEVNLDETEVSNLVSDLSDFSTEIDAVLRSCGEEPDQQQVQSLLKKLNLLADLYS